jgi:hypothetical protein
LLDIHHGKATFRWRDYRGHSRQKTMALEARESIPRFVHHVLPDGFQRIRLSWAPAWAYQAGPVSPVAGYVSNFGQPCPRARQACDKLGISNRAELMLYALASRGIPRGVGNP